MKQLLKFLSYPLSVIFYLFFALILLLFDPIQRICLRIFGYKAHKISVDIFNGLLLLVLRIVGTSIRFNIEGSIPKGVPIIIASNHQSLWDIPPLIWFLRRIHPKFISKKELGKGLPTISYNLKYGGSVLIDRKDPVQATAEIEKVAKYISKHKRSVVIFPEGTRSRNGVPKKFHRKGLLTLFEHAPDAYVLPVSVNNSWKLQRYGMFPIPLFVRLRFLAHPVWKVSEHDPEKLVAAIEKQVQDHILSV
ncbi:MAG: lysophospholipid acyltransferase family protein [Bacteroidota bacterium]